MKDIRKQFDVIRDSLDEEQWKPEERKGVQAIISLVQIVVTDIRRIADAISRKGEDDAR